MIVVMLASCILSFSDFGLKIWSTAGESLRALLHKPLVLTPARPDIVLVSREESDRRGLILTAEPRGYRVQLARSAENALVELRARGENVGMVVVDGGLAGSGLVARQATLLCPQARLVILHGPREPAEVAARVLPAL
jgi:hypothetical protein